MQQNKKSVCNYSVSIPPKSLMENKVSRKTGSK